MATNIAAKKEKRRYDSMANPPQRAALKHKPAAFYLSVSAPTLHRIVKKGLIRPNRATRHLLYDIRELDRFLKAGQY